MALEGKFVVEFNFRKLLFVTVPVTSIPSMYVVLAVKSAKPVREKLAVVLPVVLPVVFAVKELKAALVLPIHNKSDGLVGKFPFTK